VGTAKIGYQQHTAAAPDLYESPWTHLPAHSEEFVGFPIVVGCVGVSSLWTTVKTAQVVTSAIDRVNIFRL
jgi:hypothetical protein